MTKKGVQKHLKIKDENDLHLVEERHDGNGGGDAAAGGEEVQQQPQVSIVVVDVVQLTQHLQGIQRVW